MHPFEWVTQQADFDSLVDVLSSSDAYALDTEFHRERTYAPRLALVQLAIRDRIVLVDALEVDVRSLSRAFESNAVCVMHAGSQDLEILELACGGVPGIIFDTQLAALFCGYRTSSLDKLVEGFLGIELDKSAQLTDWTRRPLPEADLHYAASDVAHLLPLRDALLRELQRRGRRGWAEEEMERLRTRDRSPPDPNTLWWKLRAKNRLRGRARGVAQELAAWRDEVAQAQDRPPRTVLSDMALLALAQRPAQNANELRGVRNLDLRRFRHGDALLAAIQRGLALRGDEVCVPPAKPEKLPSFDGVIALCLAWLGQRAADEDLDSSVFGTREDVTRLVLGQPSRLGDGWRDALIGRELRAILEGRSALRVAGTTLELVDRTPN